MMTTPREAEDAVYEFTIAGGIGPAVRAALQPWTSATSEVQTIVGARCPGGIDLVDLVLWLETRGWTVASISVM